MQSGECGLQRIRECGTVAPMLAPLLRRRRSVRASTPSGPGATGVTVSNGFASKFISGTTYQWAVVPGGAGAPANEFSATNGMIGFTYSATNYEFPAAVGGAGGESLSVSSGMMTITISATNYEWPVTV